MGFKLRPAANPVECSFSKGILTYYIAGKEFYLLVPAIKTLVFEKQITFFTNETILAYLTNDKYVMVLRWDGTGSVYTRDEKVICTIFSFERPKLGVMSEYFGTLDTGKGFGCTMVLMHHEGMCVLSTIDYPLVFEFSSRENVAFLYDPLHRSSSVMPMMNLIDNRIVRTNSSLNDIIYILKGELIHEPSGVRQYIQ